jgi:hypothetical protein
MQRRTTKASRLQSLVNKRLEALNALADIRQALRMADDEGLLSFHIQERFNTVATYLGADPDWCKEDDPDWGKEG